MPGKSNPEQFYIPRETWKGLRELYGHLLIFLAQDGLQRKGNGRTAEEKKARMDAFAYGRAMLLRRKANGELTMEEKKYSSQLETAEQLEIVRGMLRAFWATHLKNHSVERSELQRAEVVLENKQSTKPQLENFMFQYDQYLQKWPNYSRLKKYLNGKS